MDPDEDIRDRDQLALLEQEEEELVKEVAELNDIVSRNSSEQVCASEII